MLKHSKNQASKLKNEAIYLIYALVIILTGCQTTGTANPSTDSDALRDDIKGQTGLKDSTPKGLINGMNEETNSSQSSSQSETTTKITSFDQLDNSEDTLIFADSENAARLNNLPSNSILNNGWHESFYQALSEARRRQKPLFIWCTNSYTSLSPNSKKLYDDLIKQTEFNQWVVNNFVALKIDKNIQEPNQTLYSKKKEHTEKLLHQLGVKTYPTLFVYTPSSNLIGKHNYIKTSTSYLQKELRRNLKLAQQEIKANQKRERRNGYRFWNLNNLDYPLFARMTLYQVGSIKLETPYQEQFTISTNSISDEDYNWLQLQRVKSQ